MKLERKPLDVPDIMNMPKPRVVCSVDNAYQRPSEVSVVIAAALVYRTA